MVEIALALGVVAFALVALVGVMPAGLKVQKDNRQDTVVNMDGTYLLDAIRSGLPTDNLAEAAQVGGLSVDMLTNYIDSITISNTFFRGNYTTYSNAPGPTGLTNGYRILGLLSSPRLTTSGRTLITNVTTAVMRSISGPAIEKGLVTRDIAFRYLVTSEIVPFSIYPPQETNFPGGNGFTAFGNLGRNIANSNNWRTAVNLATNCYDLRVTLQWPLITRGKTNFVGGGHKTFRALVAGQWLQATNNPLSLPPVYFLQPYHYGQVTNL